MHLVAVISTTMNYIIMHFDLACKMKGLEGLHVHVHVHDLKTSSLQLDVWVAVSFQLMLPK